MWTDTTRAQYARADLTLPSDLTDGEWVVLEPFFPPPSHVGRLRKWPLRRIVEAIGHLEEPSDFGVMATQPCQSAIRSRLIG